MSSIGSIGEKHIKDVEPRGNEKSLAQIYYKIRTELHLVEHMNVVHVDKFITLLF